MRGRTIWHLKRINRFRDEQGGRGQRMASSMLWEWQSLYSSFLYYDSIVLWWTQESKFRGGGQWVCLWNMFVSSFLCFCNCRPESRFNRSIIGLSCALFCPKHSQVLLVLILPWETKCPRSSRLFSRLPRLTTSPLLMILLEVNKPYWPCTRSKGTVEGV